MCLMDNVLNKFFDRFMLVFIHEIFIYSKRKEEHEENLKLVLQVLRENTIYANFSKCYFLQKQVHYLGHVIIEEGVAFDPDKFKDIMDWPTLKYVYHLRSFMGLEGYYIRFIKGFSILLIQSPRYNKRELNLFEQQRFFNS
jgi:hypothetical protein